MKTTYSILLSGGLLMLNASCTTKTGNAPSGTVTLITLDPGHFHAALVQKASYPQVDKNVYVYAPEGDDLREHLAKIDGYNNRKENPAQWNEIVYTGADYLEKMLSEKKGNLLITAGNNEKKTHYIEQAVSNGIHVLADKPMAIDAGGFEKLKACFDIAARNHVLLYDIMTERYEITTILQKELSLFPEVYGAQEKGSPGDPAIVKESVHHFFKTVSGHPLKRPAWFFDTKQQGEGIVDVTTHLVDLVQWEAFPGQVIDYRTDIRLLDANHWPTTLSREQFKEATGLDAYPAYLQENVSGDTLSVFANGNIFYTIKGIHAKVSVIWNYTYPQGGGDTHYSVMKGSKAHLIIKQGKEQGYKPALFVQAVHDDASASTYEKALQHAIQTIADRYPGISLNKTGDNLWEINIPSQYHNGHEAHFGQVTEAFLGYLEKGALPEWEVPNMLTKYYITTQALELAQKN
ncbi:MAG: Gfo/Idh/MocA family oxidoreductase [Tannerellaceae bacterium]|jgi:predicted dehydrogenase|nr:Gfo/Idh/MocA family oxidoreductase [Tannerellaceae bacterium]